MSRIAIILSFLAWLLPLQGQYQVARRVALQEGDFGSWQAKAGPARSAADAARTSRHLLVATGAPLNPERRAALRSAGIELLDWLEEDVYFAVVRLNGRFAAAPAQSGPELGLRAVGEFPAPDKISEWLTGAVSPEWSRSEWHGQPSYDVVAVLHPDAGVDEAAQAMRSAGWGLLAESAVFHRISVRVPQDEIGRLAEFDAVLHIEPVPPPKIELDNAVSAAMLKGTELQSAPFELTGKDMRVGVFDSGRVAAHQDLKDRLTALDAYNFDSAHSTHVAGTIAGSGLSSPARKGLAPEAHVHWGTYAGDVAGKTRTAVIDKELIAVNNSWGYQFTGAACALFGNYLVESRDYDRLVREQPVSIVFSMGNDRAGGNCTLLPTRAGFFSAGVPASAKNVISVGAVARGTDASTFSNYGPTRDGRLKPDVVALGVSVQSLGLKDDGAVMNGTSMAAPAVTGALALLAQRFEQQHAVSRPDPALMKAILLGTASDLGTTGPDFSYGYGMPNLIDAVQTIDTRQFETAITTGEEWSKSIPSPGAGALRVTLVWSDPEGPLNSRAALTNDLDLTVQAPGSEERLLPLTLDPVNPAAPAQPAVNRRDNVEQVVILNPPPGEFTIRVRSHRLTTESQPFAVAWSFAPLNTPPCLTVVSPNNFIAAESGGTGATSVTRPGQCEPQGVESNAPWISTGNKGPITASMALKLTVQPNQGEGTRHASLNIGGAEVRLRQTGACVTEPLPASGVVEDETRTSDCIYQGSYTKVYTFSAQSGQKIRVRMGGRGFFPWVSLRTPNGASLGAATGGTPAEAALPSANSMITLTASGTYKIIASSLLETTGPFRLAVDFGESITYESRPDIPALVADCPFEAEGELGAGSTDAGRRGDLYLTNAYHFRGYAGQRVEARLSEAAFDGYLYLVSPSGSLVAQNDDAPEGDGSLIAFTLAEGGDWRLEVTSYSPLATGKYKLTLNGCTARVR